MQNVLTFYMMILHDDYRCGWIRIMKLSEATRLIQD